jgi:hypothetical protein
MHMLLVIAFLEKVNYGGNFSPKDISVETYLFLRLFVILGTKELSIFDILFST